MFAKKFFEMSKKYGPFLLFRANVKLSSVLTVTRIKAEDISHCLQIEKMRLGLAEDSRIFYTNKPLSEVDGIEGCYFYSPKETEKQVILEVKDSEVTVEDKESINQLLNTPKNSPLFSARK